MASTVRLGLGGHYIDVVASGVMTPEAYQDILNRISQLPGKGPTLPVLWDVRDIDFGIFSGGDVRNMVRIKGKNAERTAVRSAILVNSDLGFGMARMFQIQQDLEKVADESLIGIFYDPAEAMIWLAD